MNTGSTRLSKSFAFHTQLLRRDI